MRGKISGGLAALAPWRDALGTFIVGVLFFYGYLATGSGLSALIAGILLTLGVDLLTHQFLASIRTHPRRRRRPRPMPRLP